MESYSGHTTSIAFVGGSDDAARFARHLETALKAAGWTVPNGLAMRMYNSAPYGLIIELHSADDVKRPTPVRAFLFALNEIGIRPIGTPMEGVPEGEFRIVVGLSPE
jgi:hypothetical protein